MDNRMVVYKIENTNNGKVYIGSTIEKQNRWNAHKRELECSSHINEHLQNAYNKYGSSSFKFSVLEYVDEKSNILDREQYYLDKLEPEYNIAKDAHMPMLGKSHSEETKQRMREASLGQEMSEETKEKLSRIFEGHTHPKRVREKISEGHKRENLSKETIRRLEAANRGENNSFAKLTEKKVKIIKYLLEGDNFLGKEIAKMFGVTDCAISKINTGENWSHISVKRGDNYG